MARPRKSVSDSVIQVPQIGSNVTDDTRANFYRKALKAKVEHENAVEEAKSKNGIFRSILKDAGKAGVDTTALVYALSVRNKDPDALLVLERERARMLAVSGIMPTIQTDLFANVAEVTVSDAEMEKIGAERSYEAGAKAGRGGEKRETNPNLPGESDFEAWDRGWLAGQTEIAQQMKPKGRKSREEKAADAAALAAALADNGGMSEETDATDPLGAEAPEEPTEKLFG